LERLEMRVFRRTDVSGDFSGTTDFIRTIDFYEDSDKHKNNHLHRESTNVKIID